MNARRNPSSIAGGMLLLAVASLSAALVRQSEPPCAVLAKPTPKVAAMKPERVKISKFGSQAERPGEFRVFDELTRADGVRLKPPIRIRTSPDCFEVPVMEDALWNPAKGTLTFWPDTRTPAACTVVCMGAK